MGDTMIASIRRALLTLLLSALALQLAQANDFDYRLAPRMIASDVYVLIGSTDDFSFANGGNIVNSGFIVGPSGVIVIDTGSSRRYGEQLLGAIARVTDKPIALTINTHHHPDHFLGNQAFPPDTLAATPETIHGIRTEGEGFNANMYRLNGDWMLGTEVVVPTQELAAGRTRVAGRDLEFLRWQATPPPIWS
jgi:glyoxylase-like metal-dependent hydrolase (beta-lactamase superfamily II)